MIQLAIAEDNAFSRQALEEKLSRYTDIIIRCTAQNGQEAIACLEGPEAVDLIFMDIEMPVMNGIDATRIIRQKFPQVKIVMITIYDNDEYIFNAIRAGADSYILKDAGAEKIYETIKDTLAGGSVMSPSIAARTLQAVKSAGISGVAKPEAGLQLSEREREILDQLSRGLTNKQIADALFISPFTVKRHIENIYQKLQAHSRVELIDKAKRKGLL